MVSCRTVTHPRWNAPGRAAKVHFVTTTEAPTPSTHASDESCSSHTVTGKRSPPVCRFRCTPVRRHYVWRPRSTGPERTRVSHRLDHRPGAERSDRAVPEQRPYHDQGHRAHRPHG